MEYYLYSLDEFLRFEKFLIDTLETQHRSLITPILINKDTISRIRRTIDSEGKVLASILTDDQVDFIKRSQRDYNEKFI